MLIPTDVVAGGEDFTRRIRALTDFNESAFVAAKQAEANGERDGDEFHCWSRTAV